MVIVALLAGCAQETRPVRLSEADLARAWCAEGRLEVTLKDRSRADCLTDTHAVEVEWAHKWYEAVGQSLHYARVSGLKPGIVLIVRGAAGERHLGRLRPLAQELGIDVWVIRPE